MAAPFMFFALLTFVARDLIWVSAQVDNPLGTRISIMGSVYCDACSTSTFSRHSYFLPDAEVHVQCILRASSPRTEEQIHFSVNRTTNKYGVYKLEIPNVEGIDCVDDDTSMIQSMCQATLIRSPASSPCNVPSLQATTDQISVKSRQQNLCIYSFSALSYKPTKINQTLCSKNLKEEILPGPFNSSKCFFPFFPPYKFPFPLPPLPQLPPFPSLPFPPLPPLPSFPLPPLPFQPQPPSLPFPFPPLPPLFQPPSPPPAFNLGDPRTWVPSIPPFLPTPASPSPPAFNLGDPRTWIPGFPPSPPVAPP